MNSKLLLVIFCLLTLFQQHSLGQFEEGNKQIAIRYFDEVVNKKNIALVDSIFHADYYLHGLETGSEAKGSDQIKNFLPVFFKAFPDIHYSIQDVLAEKDKVVIVARANGTHKAEIFGFEPKNSKLNNLSEIFIFRFHDKKIVEGWRLIDLHNLYKRLKGEN